MIYIKVKQHVNEETFFVSKKDDEFYPLVDQKYKSSNYVRGIGCFKVKESDLYSIPHIKEINSTTWKDYLSKYGENCLYYSLSGYYLDSPTCEEYNMQNEFKCLLNCNIDIDKYKQYCLLFDKLHDLQTKAFKKIGLYCFDFEDFYIYPSFKHYHIIGHPYMEVFKHDEILWNLYCKQRKINMIGNYRQIYEKQKQYFLNRECYYPTDIKDRIIDIFGLEAANIYERMLTFFD